MLRRYGRRGELKDVEDFAWRRIAKGQRDNYCRPCRSDYKQEHYAANKKRYIANARRRKAEVLEARLEFLVEFLLENPCVDCGERDPVVLEFDHREDKRFDISRGLRDRPWADVLNEMSKCDVVCANCHGRRSSERGNFLRAAVVSARKSEPSGLGDATAA